MKKFYLLIALVTVVVSHKIILDGKEVTIRCREAVAGDTIVCETVENDACWDPVYQRWEPCY